jgi:PAS domain S-box-containing protein
LLSGLTVGALGAVVLVGWGFDLGVLKSVFPGLTSMKANTALGMLLCGSALANLSLEKAGQQTRFLTKVMATGVIALAALTLSEYLFGWKFGIDQWLFRDADELVATSRPGRMSPATAFCFLLTGVALLAGSQPVSMRLRRPMLEALGLGIIVVAGLALASYLSAAFFSFRWWSYTGMAVHTAAGFLLLGFGLLAVGRREGRLKWSLDPWTTRGFAVSILSLVVATGISYHFTNELQQSAAWVSHTQEVLKEIGGVTAGVASLGSSQRGYINTGSDRFLEQEEAIKVDLHKRIDTLRKLTADNPVQKPRLDQLTPLIAQRIGWGEKTIAARRKGGLSAAEQMIATGEGIELTDSIRRLIKALEDEEYGLLDQRQEKERTISSTTFLLLPLGAFLSITFLSLGLFFLNTGMGERAQAEEKAAWLATFPERNPSFIVEVDLATGIIHYQNPYALRWLPDLQNLGLRHPWIAGLEEAAPALAQSPGEPLRREIEAGARFYAQTINYIPETKRVRVYGTDITERKQVETTAARLAAIVESSDDAIVGKDLQGVVTSWNGGAENLFGYPAREMVGQPVARLIPPERLPEETEILSRIKHGENMPNFETVRVRKDGSTIQVSVTVSPIRDSAGNVVGASKVARDITERKRAEEARRVSEERYRTLFEYAPDGIVIVDPKGYYLDVNLSICKMLGYTREEFIGLNATDIVAPAEIPHIGPALDVIQTKSDYQREWQFRRKDRSVFAVDTIATAMPDGNLLAMIRDITERKRAEEELRKSREEFKDLFDSAPIGYHELDAQGRLVRVNQTELEMLGYTFEELAGQFVWSLSADPEAARRAVLDKLNGAPPPERYERMLRRKNGTTIPVVVQDLLVKGKDGAVTGIRTVFQDITERKVAEEKIQALNADLEKRVIERTAQLEAANKELEAFSYSVSHDLRAPLRAVDGFSQAVLEDYGPQLPAECRQDLQTIRNAAQKMGELIDDLLTFSRLSRLPLSKSTVDTGKLVRGVLEELGLQREGRRIEMRIADLPPCQADRALLKQVWVNLLSNALKYSGKREAAVVEVGCGREKDQEVYFVRDNGTGFDMKYAHKLFGVFQRLHRAEDYEGTGVGLAIVQRIIHRHGGRIWAESAVDMGATFYFTLEGEIKL